MAPLKFLQQLKNFKVKRKASFFDPAKKTAVNLKFGLIALLPFLFLFYNHMRKTKKTRQNRKSFYLGVTMCSIFAVVAVVFLVFIFNNNVSLTRGVNNINPTVAIATAQNSVNNATVDNYNKVMNEVETYTEKNIKSLAAAHNAGDGGSTVDSVNFINTNRALVFYHENNDQYLAEEVFNDQNNQVSIEKFTLKVKNNIDYSGGVYGAD